MEFRSFIDSMRWLLVCQIDLPHNQLITSLPIITESSIMFYEVLWVVTTHGFITGGHVHVILKSVTSQSACTCYCCSVVQTNHLKKVKRTHSV